MKLQCFTPLLSLLSNGEYYIKGKDCFICSYSSTNHAHIRPAHRQDQSLLLCHRRQEYLSVSFFSQFDSSGCPIFCVLSVTLHFQGELSMGSSFLVLLSWYKGAPLSPIHKLSVDQAVMRHGRTLTERQL